MDLWAHIGEAVFNATGESVRGDRDSIGGGCINQAVRIRGEQRDFFVKLNEANRIDMFEAEAEGLAELARSNTLRVPTPICVGLAERSAYLVLEYLPFGRGGSGAEMGRQLAAMHRVTRDRFGWHRDNTIGSTPQDNAWATDWIRFWRERRLGYQLALAARNGFAGELQREGERLMSCFEGLFGDYQPVASLLHGDLWSGNYGYLADGTPVIFDPAVYFGDREADIAMTELFGGFGREFYTAYSEAWPLDADYPIRKSFYNLYHILNHMNMFGGGYHSQSLSMIKRLLAELR